MVSAWFYVLLPILSASVEASGGLPQLYEIALPRGLSVHDEATFTCVVKSGSDGPYSFLWTKDGVEVVSDERSSVTVLSSNTAVLTLADITPQDNGNYTCKATNAAGSDSVSAILGVTGTDFVSASSNPLYDVVSYSDTREMMGTLPAGSVPVSGGHQVVSCDS